MHYSVIIVNLVVKNAKRYKQLQPSLAVAAEAALTTLQEAVQGAHNSAAVAAAAAAAATAAATTTTTTATTIITLATAAATTPEETTTTTTTTTTAAATALSQVESEVSTSQTNKGLLKLCKPCGHRRPLLSNMGAIRGHKLRQTD